MSIGLRVVILLVCAYAGWETAGLQFGRLPEPQQLTQKVVRHPNRLNTLMKKPKLHVEEQSQPRNIQRADIAPVTVMRWLSMDILRRSLRKKRPQKSGNRVACEVSHVAGRNLRRILEVTKLREIACAASQQPITMFRILINR